MENKGNLIIILSLVIMVLLFFNIFQVNSFGKIFDNKLIETKEAARPAKIELIIINTDCKDCYDIQPIVNLIESSDANITDKKELSFSSDEAKDIIRRYGIEKAPTVVIKGEIERAKSLKFKLNDIGEFKEDAFFFTKLEPLFIETKTGDIKGKVSLIELKKEDCSQCSNLSLLIGQLKASGLKIVSQSALSIGSEEGKSLINKYKIEKAPTMILSPEAKFYSTINENWNKVGSVEDDGYYIIRNLNPPYYDINKSRVVGLVSITYLTDKTCKDCYDPEQFHKAILKGLGMVFSDERRVDVSDTEGKSIVGKYNIELVPTMILRGDVSEYTALVRAWKSVGSIESDNSYVFRTVDIAKKTYKNLTSSEIVQVAK